jgi:hypothetical protein
MQLFGVNFIISDCSIQCCVDNDTVRRVGVTFDQFVCLGRCNGAVVDAYRASDVTLEQFRHTVNTICGLQPKDRASFIVSRFVERSCPSAPPPSSRYILNAEQL